MEKMVGRWDAKDGWNGAVQRAKLLEPVLTVSPASWKPEENGTLTCLPQGSGFSYRKILWKEGKSPGALGALLDKHESIKAVGIERMRSTSYLPSFVQRPNYVLLSPRLEDCNDPNLCKLATDNEFILDEGGYHVLEPTILHFLIRENASHRLEAWFSRKEKAP